MVERLVVKIAVDPHKRINAVVVVDAPGSVLARGTFAQSTAGFAELMGFDRCGAVQRPMTRGNCRPEGNWNVQLTATAQGAELLR